MADSAPGVTPARSLAAGKGVHHFLPPQTAEQEAPVPSSSLQVIPVSACEGYIPTFRQGGEAQIEPLIECSGPSQTVTFKLPGGSSSFSADFNLSRPDHSGNPANPTIWSYESKQRYSSLAWVFSVHLPPGFSCVFPNISGDIEIDLATASFIKIRATGRYGVFTFGPFATPEALIDSIETLLRDTSCDGILRMLQKSNVKEELQNACEQIRRTETSAAEIAGGSYGDANLFLERLTGGIWDDDWERLLLPHEGLFRILSDCGCQQSEEHKVASSEQVTKPRAIDAPPGSSSKEEASPTTGEAAGADENQNFPGVPSGSPRLPQRTEQKKTRKTRKSHKRQWDSRAEPEGGGSSKRRAPDCNAKERKLVLEFILRAYQEGQKGFAVYTAVSEALKAAGVEKEPDEVKNNWDTALRWYKKMEDKEMEDKKMEDLGHHRPSPAPMDGDMYSLVGEIKRYKCQPNRPQKSSQEKTKSVADASAGPTSFPHFSTSIVTGKEGSSCIPPPCPSKLLEEMIELKAVCDKNEETTRLQLKRKEEANNLDTALHHERMAEKLHGSPKELKDQDERTKKLDEDDLRKVAKLAAEVTAEVAALEKRLEEFTKSKKKLKKKINETKENKQKLQNELLGMLRNLGD